MKIIEMPYATETTATVFGNRGYLVTVDI